MSDARRLTIAAVPSAVDGSATTAASAASGASWSPPTVAGPLITFRGKQTAASSLQDDVRAARDAGYERGRSEGLAAAAAEIAQRIAELESRRQLLEGLARQMVAPLERCDEETAAEMARLALTVGAHLARRELALDPRQVIAIIRECLTALPSATREVRVHVHPRDAAVLRAQLEGGGGAASFTLVEDPMLSRGGCRIEAEASRIDARLESRVAAALALVLGDERADPRGAETLPPLPDFTPPPRESPPPAAERASARKPRNAGKRQAP
jgi:flagellar assembly protein FliH